MRGRLVRRTKLEIDSLRRFFAVCEEETKFVIEVMMPSGARLKVIAYLSGVCPLLNGSYNENLRGVSELSRSFHLVERLSSFFGERG